MKEVVDSYYDCLFQAEETIWGLATPKQKEIVYRFAHAYGHLWAMAITQREVQCLSLGEIRSIAAERQRPGLPYGIEYPSMGQVDGHLGYHHVSGSGRLEVFVPFGDEESRVMVTITRPDGSFVRTYLDYSGDLQVSEYRGEGWYTRHLAAWNRAVEALFPHLDWGNFPRFPVPVGND